MDCAVVVHETGGPEALRLEPHDPGEPRPGQLRVRVAAAGVNFVDVYFRTGLYPRPRGAPEALAERPSSRAGTLAYAGGSGCPEVAAA
jgi:NADPH:quinone reductase-like Zn-dependent oxidoreductase